MHINKYFIAALLSVGILKGTSNAQDLSREMEGDRDMEMKVKVEKEDGSESKEKVEIEGDEKTYKFENEQYELKVKKEKDEVKLKYEGDPNQFEQNVSKHLKGSSQGNQTNVDVHGNNNYFPEDPSVNIINGSPNLGDTTNARLEGQDETSASARQRSQNESLRNNQGQPSGRENKEGGRTEDSQMRNQENQGQASGNRNLGADTTDAMRQGQDETGVNARQRSQNESLRNNQAPGTNNNTDVDENPDNRAQGATDEEDAEALTNEDEDNTFDTGQQSNASKDSKSLRSKYQNDPDFKSGASK